MSNSLDWFGRFWAWLANGPRHEVNHYIHFPTPAPPAAPAPPSLDDFAPSPPEQSEMDRAKELQCGAKTWLAAGVPEAP